MILRHTHSFHTHTHSLNSFCPFDWLAHFGSTHFSAAQVKFLFDAPLFILPNLFGR